jgi:hypothetical protein
MINYERRAATCVELRQLTLSVVARGSASQALESAGISLSLALGCVLVVQIGSDLLGRLCATGISACT